MAAIPRSSLTVVWAVLSILTVASCWLASQGQADAYRLMSLGVLALALIKVRLVIRHFMEVRTGPRWLRRTCDAWLLCVFGMILAFYQIGS